jgi:demethylmenaquinone methyltransferase/2-methoxy-6-polyprenyl-1,4-benzoquinol methylase
MAEKILSSSQAQNLYDRIGSRYDWFEFYEGKAKERAFEALNLSPRLKVLSVGVGTGKDFLQILTAISPGGIAYGLDISPVMLKLARERSAAPVCRADARILPFASNSFDRLYASYVLDLLPAADLPDLLVDFSRVLTSGGQMVITALTEGVDRPSRALVAAWKGVFSLSPALCGGCRPLQLLELVKRAGFVEVQRDVIVQLGVPSEIISAVKT